MGGNQVVQLIGIISDTHDNLDAMDRAVEYLNSRDLEMVIHAGDYIAPFAAIALKRLNAKIVGVFGNNDGEKTGLQDKASDLGSTIEDLLEFTQGGRKIAVYHGTIKAVFDALVKSKNMT